MPDVLQDVIDQVTDATLTISGTKDLTGDSKKQVLFSLTTKESGVNSTTAMSTFTDLAYTSLVITAYKNGNGSTTEPLEETPLYIRTIQGAQLNRAAISLEITHEVTVGSDSEFQAGTSYVFDVRFMKTGGVTLLRKTHTFQDAPDVTDYNFVANVDANGIGLTVTTDADAPVLNEVFVEIIKLSDTPGVTEADRDGNGNIIVYSLQKYEVDTNGDAFAAGAGAQVIRANSAADLPNAGNDDDGNPHALASGSSYNMNVIFVTDGGTSDKHRVTPDSSSNTSLLLSSAPSAFKQTFIDQQKTATDVGNDAAKNTLDASILQVLEITAISGSEIIDKVSTQIDFGDNTKTFASDADYATSGEKAIEFETDFVTSLIQNEGEANELTRKFIAIRYTSVADSNDASSTTITGTALSADSANYPTIASDAANFQNRAVAQVCTETVKMFNNKPMGISSTTGSTFGTADGVDKTIKVIYVQLTELDFGMLINNVNTTISNSSTTLNSSVVDKLVHRTDVTGTLTESVPNDTSSFTIIKMDLPTDTITTTQLASGTLQVTQDELNAAGDQSFTLQSTTNLLSALIDTSIIDFVQLTLDDNSGSDSVKSFTLDSSTTPTAVDFLKGDQTGEGGNDGILTLTNDTEFGAVPSSTLADNYGVLPQGNNSFPSESLGLKPYSAKDSIAFDSASLVSQVHLVVHMKGYKYGAQLFSGVMSLRYELGSLINGAGNIVDYADTNPNDGDTVTSVSIYGVNGQYEGSITGTGKRSEAAWTNNVTTENAGLTSLIAGTKTKGAFVAMGRTPLKPTVTATQESKAVLPNDGDGAAFTLTITENIKLQEFNFPGVNGANGDLAPYDLTVAANRPSTATIILRKNGSASTTNILGTTPLTQTFIIDLTGAQTTSQGVGSAFIVDNPLNTDGDGTTTAGEYSVILENGQTLGLDENGDAATVTFSPGDRLELFVALGNATYGTSPSTYISGSGSSSDFNGSYGPAGADGTTANGYYLTRFDTLSGSSNNNGDQLALTNNNFLDKDAGAATDNVIGGAGNKFIDVFGVNADRSAGPTVGAPTVSFGPENKGNDYGATGRFILDVQANANDIDQLIDYTKLEVNFTVGSTTTTHTFGTFGTALATDLSENEGGITKTNKQNYVVTFNSGETIGGASATFNGGDTVSATAKLMTDYDRTGAVSASTDTKTIRTNATLKNAASNGSAFLTQNKALFDVDLIDKNTLKLAPYYFNHGISSVDTWDDIITLNGNSVGDLALEIQVRYERENNGFNTFDADQDEVPVPAFAESVTIVDGDNFAALADTDVITLTLQASQVNKLKVRLPSDAANHGIVRLMVTIRLTTVYADGIAVNDIQTAPFTPYLEKLDLDSVEAVSAVGDTLTWKAKFTPEAYKTNLKEVEMALAIQKNNIASHTLALHNATANNNAIKIVDVTTERTTVDTNGTSYTSSATPTDGAEAFVTFQTDLSQNSALRGSYLVPKFKVTSTASNDSHNTSKDFTAYENAQTHNVADSDFTTRAGQKLAARAAAVVVDNPIVGANNLVHFSLVPNGNTSGVILTVDNEGTKQLGLGFIAGQADQTNAIGKFINNNSFNAVFGVNVTLTLGTEATTFRFGGVHDLTITPTVTTVQDVLDALNAMPIFPFTMLLPGPANGGTAATAAWSLSNAVFDNGTGALAGGVILINNATIQLQFEGTVSDTSKVSYVAVTHVSGGAGAGVSTTEKTDENGDVVNDFIVLSLTNDADNGQPLPTLVVDNSGTTTGDVTDAIFAQTGISNTTGTVSSIATTQGVTIA
jgi:hypothetical protein